MEASTILCPHCQATNPARNLYCQACGKPLIQATPQPVVPPAMPVIPEVAPVTPTVMYPPSSTDQPGPTPGVPAYPPQVQPPIAPAGYPPQNYAPQGMPPQGMPQQQGYAPQGVPPQQAYYPPVSPPPPAAPSIGKLGARVDGWADLASGAGEKAEAVRAAFVESMNARAADGVSVEKVDFGANGPTMVVKCAAGSVAVQASGRGADLFLAWSLYVPRVLKMKMLGILAGVAFAASFLTALGMVSNFGYFLVNWIFGTINWFMPVTILAMVAGYVWKGSFWFFFMEEPSEAGQDQLAALVLAVHHSLMEAAAAAGVDTGGLRDKKVFVAGSRERKF